MTKRVTVTLDDNVLKKLKILQANLIRETLSTVSFSKLVNQIISKHLK